MTMIEQEYKGRTFKLVGTFGHVRALLNITQPLAESESGIIVDDMTNAVAEVFGPECAYRDWQSAVRSLGVSLFTLYVNSAARAYASDPYGCINPALSILMSESRAAAPLIVNDHGETVATVARIGKDGASIVWGDTGRVERWRSLSWVVLNGEPVALVGCFGGRIVQV
jgi:hypothetical protein